jgi:hypothetical protein
LQIRIVHHQLLKYLQWNKMRDDHVFFSLILTYQCMLYYIWKFERNSLLLKGIGSAIVNCTCTVNANSGLVMFFINLVIIFYFTLCWVFLLLKKK